MKEIIDFTKPVKLVDPQPGEESLLYRVVNYNEVTERVIIEVIDTESNLPPRELVSIKDIKNQLID